MRYDVTIVLTQHHSFAVEAPSADAAWASAMATLDNREAEHSEITISCERGVKSDPADVAYRPDPWPR